MSVSERIFSNPVILNEMVKDWYLDFSFAMRLPIMKPRKEKRMSTAIIERSKRQRQTIQECEFDILKN